MQEITDKQQFLEFTTSPEGKYTKLVHFWADWSPACSELDKLLDELKDGEWGNEFEAAKIEAENLPDISLEFDIKAVPTILAFQNGKMVEKLEGFVPIKLKELVVKSHFDGTAAKSKNMEQNNEAIDDGTPELKENLNDRLKRLINRARLTLFMKGSPDMPKCGFSRQIVELLRQNDIEFWTFDILCDEVVRQGLKEYSDWPTYPQLYLDGELLGGLDVIREEMKDPNFVEKLPKLSNRK